ncbi:MAG: hypothetical protein ACKV2V_02625 [Blastocatellia bacterium]
MKKAEKRKATAGPCPVRPPQRKDEVIPVTVTARDGKVIVEPRSLTLKIATQQEAQWKSTDGTLEIRFAPKQTPFGGHSFRAPQCASVLSGVPDKRNIRKEPFRYVVIVTTSESVLVSQEQEIIVAKG